MDQIHPRIRVLNSRHIKQIHKSSLHILWKNGVRIDSEKARKVLLTAGCRHLGDNRIGIPGDLIEWAIQFAPSDITIYDRHKKPYFQLGLKSRHQPVFGIGVTNLWYQDPQTNQVVPFIRQHLQTASLLASVLDGYDVLSTPGVPQDISSESVDLVSTLDMLAHTSKPLILLISHSQSFEQVLDLLRAMIPHLSDFPCVIPYFNPHTPLVFHAHMTDHLTHTVNSGLPLIFSSYGMAGATTPVPPDSALSILNAELLAGLVFVQLIKEGAPIIMGALPAGFDMRSMTSHYTAMSMVLNLACAEMMHHYHIPHAGTSGSGPGWGADLISSGMLCMNHLSSCLGKVGLIPFIGGNFDSLAFCPKTVVYSDQIIRQVRDFANGFSLNLQAFDDPEFDQMVREGSFLTSNETLQSLQKTIGRQDDLWPVYSLPMWRDADEPRADAILKSHTINLLQNLRPPADRDELLDRGRLIIQELIGKIPDS
jgi:trimethylamine---corrinoid protein Co-methyltransferase